MHYNAHIVDTDNVNRHFLAPKVVHSSRLQEKSTIMHEAEDVLAADRTGWHAALWSRPAIAAAHISDMAVAPPSTVQLSTLSAVRQEITEGSGPMPAGANCSDA